MISINTGVGAGMSMSQSVGLSVLIKHMNKQIQVVLHYIVIICNTLCYGQEVT